MTPFTASYKRRLRKFLSLDFGDGEDEARYLLSKLKERPRRTWRNEKLTTSLRREAALRDGARLREFLGREPDKKASRKEAMASLRKKVFERARNAAGNEWCCELCDPFDFRGCNIPTDLDHLISGSGNRLAYQGVETTVASCRQCHRERTRNPESKYLAIVAWAKRHGYAVPKQIEDRHQKYLRLHPEAPSP